MLAGFWSIYHFWFEQPVTKLECQCKQPLYLSLDKLKNFVFGENIALKLNLHSTEIEILHNDMGETLGKSRQKYNWRIIAKEGSPSLTQLKKQRRQTRATKPINTIWLQRVVMSLVGKR